MKIINNRKRGITLIELIIVIPIFLLIIGTAFSINGLANKIFNKSVNQSSSQQDVRIAVEYMTRELRNAQMISTDVEVIKAQSNSYNALRIVNNKLVKQTFTGDNLDGTTTLGSKLTTCNFLTSANAGVLKVEVGSTEKEQVYNTVFEILLNNINEVVIPNGDAEDTVIYYKN